MSLQATSGDSVIFRPDLASPAALAASGGVVSGVPIINHGARWNGAVSPHQFLTSGKRILDFSIYPVALTPVQVKGLYERLKKLLNV